MPSLRLARSVGRRGQALGTEAQPALGRRRRSDTRADDGSGGDSVDAGVTRVRHDQDCRNL